MPASATHTRRDDGREALHRLVAVVDDDGERAGRGRSPTCRESTPVPSSCAGYGDGGVVSEGGGGGDRAVRAWSGRTRDGRAEGVGEERTSAPSADEASWRRTTNRAGARGTRARGGGTPDPRRIDREGSDREVQVEDKPQATRATADVTPTVRARSKASSNSPSPITTRGETTPRQAARSALGPDEARGADTRSSREARSVTS